MGSVVQYNEIGEELVYSYMAFQSGALTLKGGVHWKSYDSGTCILGNGSSANPDPSRETKIYHGMITPLVGGRVCHVG